MLRRYGNPLSDKIDGAGAVLNACARNILRTPCTSSVDIALSRQRHGFESRMGLRTARDWETLPREGGKIVNLASIAAFRGLDPAEMNALPYNASKGGVVALTVDLAVKWARHRITVNAIAPGWFPTDMSDVLLQRSQAAFTRRIPLGRLGGADDLKGAVVFLASRASDYVTGVTLPVDGGLLATW